MRHSTPSEKATDKDRYDSPWKEALERYFQAFMAFYFPAASASVDWSRGYVSLDQELQEVGREGALGKRYVDKLVRLAPLGGGEQWVYVHVEVQGSREPRFAERMFVYNYRLYDRYRRPVASLAVLADGGSWRPERFGYQLFGCRMPFDFPVAKLAAYEADLGRLLDDPNPFALVTAAHLLTRRTRGDMSGRLEAKLRLLRLLYARGWERQQVVDLFAILDWMMRLPEPLSRRFRREMRAIEESEQMRYVTSIERLALKEGRVEGRLEGRLEGKLGMLEKQLEHRFGPLPEAVRARLRGGGEAELEAWGTALLSAVSLEAVFGPQPH